MASFLLAPLSLHLLFSLLHSVTTAGFSAELIHVDSPLSPFYDPSKTLADRLSAAAKRSLSRANYFSMRSTTTHRPPLIDSSSSSDVITLDAFQSGLVHYGTSDYLMWISIGTPPLKFLAILDTGSELIWTQCLPCTACYPQNSSFYDPKKSSTYKQVPCDAPKCAVLGSGQCENSVCNYQVFYNDKSYTKGELTSETFTFDNNFSVEDIAFGCSHDAKGFPKISAGLVGLAAGQLSLINQLGTIAGGKFSYCLVPYNDKSNNSGQLRFGEIVSGDQVVSTPLVLRVDSNLYYLNLEEIVVGKVHIPVGGNDYGNIIIDSGTTDVLLPTDLTKQVEKAVMDFVGLPNSGDPDEIFHLCFDTSNITTVNLPDIVYQFRGATVTVSSKYSFGRHYDNIVCLLMLAINEEVGVFGNMAQQNMRVGYDLVDRKIMFDPKGCPA